MNTVPDFFNRYKQIMVMATESGARYVVPRKGARFQSISEMRNFISACHRGYEKAQQSVFRELTNLRNNKSIDPEAKDNRELALRRIIDSIAWMILKTEKHVVRRMILHDSPPPIDLDVVRRTMQKANELNSESRQTFTLVTDLSTFIHISDLLRVDFRGKYPNYKLIELKKGKVNEILSEKLKNYPLEINSIANIREDPEIDMRHKKQAVRMFKQVMRMTQVVKTLESDEGIDVKYDIPIQLIGPRKDLFAYDVILDEMIRTKSEDQSACTVQSCIHIGIGYSEIPDEAKRKAWEAAQAAYCNHWQEAGHELLILKEEISSLCKGKDLAIATNLLESNLRSLDGMPFPLWGISHQDKIDMLSGKRSVFVIVDFVSFIWLGRSLGLKMSLSSRKDAAEIIQRFHIGRLPLDNRLITIHTAEGPLHILGGVFSRFVNDLTMPIHYLSLYKD